MHVEHTHLGESFLLRFLRRRYPAISMRSRKLINERGQWKVRVERLILSISIDTDPARQSIYIAHANRNVKAAPQQSFLNRSRITSRINPVIRE